MIEREEVNPNESSEPAEKNIGLITVLLFLALFILLGFKLVDLYQTKKVICKEKIVEEKQLKQEVSRLEKERADMKKKEEYLKTSKGVEEVARDKLGMIKKNEIPFIVCSDPGIPSKDAQPDERKQDNEKEKEQTKKNSQ